MLRSNDQGDSGTPPALDSRGGSNAKPVVDCHARDMHVRWGSPEPWLRGPWLTAVARHETPLVPRSDWEPICRYREGQIEPWEYGMRLAHGVRLQRQITYLGRDGVLFLADAILSTRRACWAVEVACGIGPGVLRADGPSPADPPPGNGSATWLTPLVPTENLDPEADSPKIGSGTATWGGRFEGRAAFLPCVFLTARSEAERQSPPLWRSLTVTERGQVVAADTAVAYRVQLAARQWVFYRSLAAPGNRAFLGCNFAGESLVGTFGKKGVAALLEVQLEE